MTSRIERGAVAALLGAALSAGCGEGAGKAQEEAGASVVPSEGEVAVQRADRARVRGAEDAPIRLVEISDFECPFCAQYFRETYPAIDSLYVQTGIVRYVWISFPNPQHARAWPAIEAAFCAGTVGRFWEMHDLLFQRQEEWRDAKEPAAVFRRYAEELGIDGPSFGDCTENDRVAQLQVRDYQGAISAGINSTPFFVLADSVAIRGASPLETFQREIDAILEARGAGAASDGDAGEPVDPGAEGGAGE